MHGLVVGPRSQRRLADSAQGTQASDGLTRRTWPSLFSQHVPVAVGPAENTVSATRDAARLKSDFRSSWDQDVRHRVARDQDIPARKHAPYHRGRQAMQQRFWHLVRVHKAIPGLGRSQGLLSLNWPSTFVTVYGLLLTIIPTARCGSVACMVST